jgi:hypothetical protein
MSIEKDAIFGAGTPPASFNHCLIKMNDFMFVVKLPLTIE